LNFGYSESQKEFDISTFNIYDLAFFRP